VGVLREVRGVPRFAVEVVPLMTPDAAASRRDKLATHDVWARRALATIEDWLVNEPDVFLAMAKGRHAEGSLRFGDRLMYEHDQDTLLAEAAQELADAINYIALWKQRADG